MSDTNRFEIVRSEIREIEEFLANPGWQRYKQLVEGALRVKRDEVFNVPIHSTDDAFRLCELKGNMAGMQLCFSLFGYRLMELQREMTELQQQLEMEEASDGIGE